VNLPVEYRHIDSTINHTGRAFNASEVVPGLFPEPMKIGQHLSMKLFFSLESGLGTIDVHDEWSGWHSFEWRLGDYRSGVRFVDISQKYKKLKNILSSLSQWPPVFFRFVLNHSWSWTSTLMLRFCWIFAGEELHYEGIPTGWKNSSSVGSFLNDENFQSSSSTWWGRMKWGRHGMFPLTLTLTLTLTSPLPRRSGFAQQAPGRGNNLLFSI